MAAGSGDRDTVLPRKAHHIVGEALAVESSPVAPTATPEAQAPEASLLAFRLDGQSYALPIAPIQEIIEIVAMTPLPRSSDLIEGLINVRGQPTPVVNLRRVLALPVLPLHLHTPLIIARSNGKPVGWIVDELLGVITLPARQIIPSAAFLADLQPRLPFLQGVAYPPASTLGQALLLLDPDHLCDEQAAEALTQAWELLAKQSFGRTEFAPQHSSEPPNPLAAADQSPSSEVADTAPVAS